MLTPEEKQLRAYEDELKAKYDRASAFVWLVAYGLALAVTVLYGVYHGW